MIVRFLVIGAHAMMFHAAPRYTKDLLDIEWLARVKGPRRPTAGEAVGRFSLLQLPRRR